MQAGAPAPRPTGEHVCVVQQPVEERGAGRGVAEQFALVRDPHLSPGPGKTHASHVKPE